MGMKMEGLYCKGCGGKNAAIQKIKEEKGNNMFAVVCPSCEARGYHCAAATKRTK